MGNMTDKRTITVSVNGTKHTKEVPVRITLADFIRYELGLTGTHLGCEHGVCGACTILLDGRSARSCLMLAVQANGHELLTVEGIAPSADRLHPLQQLSEHRHRNARCGETAAGPGGAIAVKISAMRELAFLICKEGRHCRN